MTARQFDLRCSDLRGLLLQSRSSRRHAAAVVKAGPAEAYRQSYLGVGPCADAAHLLTDLFVLQVVEPWSWEVEGEVFVPEDPFLGCPLMLPGPNWPLFVEALKWTDKD